MNGLRGPKRKKNCRIMCQYHPLNDNQNKLIDIRDNETFCRQTIKFRDVFIPL